MYVCMYIFTVQLVCDVFLDHRLVINIKSCEHFKIIFFVRERFICPLSFMQLLYSFR